MEKKSPLIIAAPLAGYTNLAYRRFLKKFGCDLVVSEMISDFALIYHNQETKKMTETSQDERPVALQLFGGSKESLLGGLKELQEIADYDYLDINLGCPVHKVIKNNAGSAWLDNSRKDELLDMMTELVKASKHPVTAKIRLGISKDTINVEQTCKILEKAGVKMITVHGRTRTQMYEGTSDYDYIKKAKESVKIKVIANGDINTLDKAIEVLNYTGCDGVALGRGILGNPFLITQIKKYYETGERLPLPTIEMQIEYLKEHFNLLMELKGEFHAVQEIRGISTHYLKGFSNVRDYKVRFSTIKEAKEFFKLCSLILKDEKIQRV